ncbi:hypothetical protein [Aquirufa aurantiipilula]|uniref:DUF4834 family protein n=1 Tax=Aquirufa aurantiipilula TaxID=2696561 RepID=A0ABT6BJB9_9BACT|nr:hypothetical protein [Aquirufa aurantiipilula]MBZ1326056.1 DUF4834 family protein [Aquirufa aurantiipilula]MDF5690562.1 hypothetical protein [Aquirufa aurantiipilula]
MLKILGLIFLFIYVIRPLFKLLFKSYIITQVHRQQSEQAYRQKEATKREGSIDVDYVPPQAKSKPRTTKADDGDYVPFEEIKE